MIRRFLAWLGFLSGTLLPDRERKIYRFWDGSKGRRADPLAIHRRLVEKGGPEWYALMQSLEVARLEGGAISAELAREQTLHVTATVAELAGLARYAFEVEPLSQDAGLTDAETLDLIADYLTWTAAVEAETRPQPSLPNSTVPQPPASSTTGPAADSTSTGTTADRSAPTP